MDTFATENRPPSGTAHEPSAALARLLARMPKNVSASFTPQQLEGLEHALYFDNPPRHPLNLRVTLFNRAYLVIMAGRERRSPPRRIEDRERHPLRSPGNIAFLIGVAILGLIIGNALKILLLGI